jgi:hypothetical protein
MSESINRRGLSEAWQEKETQVSELLMEAEWSRARGQHGWATRLFLEAAGLEEELAQEVADQPDLGDQYRIHALSAASCWAEVGAWRRAKRLAANLLSDHRAPLAFRQEVEALLEQLEAAETKRLDLPLSEETALYPLREALVPFAPGLMPGERVGVGSRER